MTKCENDSRLFKTEKQCILKHVHISMKDGFSLFNRNLKIKQIICHLLQTSDGQNSTRWILKQHFCALITFERVNFTILMCKLLFGKLHVQYLGVLGTRRSWSNCTPLSEDDYLHLVLVVTEQCSTIFSSQVSGTLNHNKIYIWITISRNQYLHVGPK